ncbi:type IX secretion system membrane protein PorP/SprF [Flavobacterium plurextorum]|uniref:PorP/SprF family type IX secretion system membrane protein n=1 Tax=Flavobacterium TaxID=237 RepID=UPI000C1A3352|nr:MULTISPECIES: type IX secretion system membrane protein PorP/SprF [Flavobacterium]PIF70692.1 type IX secretion system PorP/SprF family membrane protein [Flavobacterium sp. 2]UUW07894.1 type IX secretion system membrane protein PorP/SprF [Flavobacterium plurextorum]
MNIKKIGLLIIIVLTSNYMSAQQDAQYTQYMYNPTVINPAYAGSRDVMSIFGLYRTQWVGLEGAPKTGTLSMHTPIENSRVGLGLSLVNDRIGPSDDTTLAADISYTIDVSYQYKLAFGVKGSANLINVDYTKLDIYDPSDPRYQQNIDNKFSPNVGAGVYLYSDNTYVGLSVPALLETSHYSGMSTYVAKEKIHYYFMAGHVFDLDYNLKFKPSALVKMTEGAPLQVDLSANFLFNEKFTAGVAYRWSAALSALVGFQVSDGLFIGYAYDAETTKLANYNSGSHEIFLRFELFKKFDKIVSPRFF